MEEEEEEEEEEGPTCRICFGTGHVGHCAGKPSAERLVRPCLCKGSMQFVHIGCLNRWRRVSASPTSFYRCDQCGYEYNISRARICDVLESNAVVVSTSVFTFVAMLGLLGLVVQRIPLTEVLGVQPLPDVLYTQLQCVPVWRIWSANCAKLALRAQYTHAQMQQTHGSAAAAATAAAAGTMNGGGNVAQSAFGWCSLDAARGVLGSARALGNMHYRHVIHLVAASTSSLCDTLASGGVVLGLAGYASLLWSIYRQDRSYWLRYVLPSLLAVISQSGLASATRLFVCLGVYAIHQEYYKKMLETARQTMMNFGENILEVDAEEENDTQEEEEEEEQEAEAAAAEAARGSGIQRRGGKGPLRVLAYLVKRMLLQQRNPEQIHIQPPPR